MFSKIHCLVFGFVLLVCGCAYADGSFDLSGPKIEVKVTRAGKTLPISEVPNLLAGDKLSITPAFPDNESVHYVLAVAFLQGATNPPPDGWFTKAETWTKQVRKDGIVVTVPQKSQQALMFLAPQTSGDFNTLRSAVQGKPGAFVRAARDLELASQSRMRVEKYLNAINDPTKKDSDKTDSDALEKRSALVARSLNLKVDDDCFKKPKEEQAECLAQNSDQMVMDDGHGQSLMAAIASSPAVDLVGAVSDTPGAGGGAYSPYIGVVVDLAKVMESFHTAQYQYIPALGLPQQELLNLKLNNPPSFHKPESVLVVALPPVATAVAPVMTSVEPKRVYCSQDPSLALQAQGAPLVFATENAHELKLHVQNKAGQSVDIPIKADPARGGFVWDGALPSMDKLGPELSGTVRGSWGFDGLVGPAFQLRNSSEAAHWGLSKDEESALVVDQEDTFHLHSDLAACVEKIEIKKDKDKPAKTSWKLVAPDDIEVKVSLADSEPGAATLSVKQFGVAKAEDVQLRTYGEECHLEKFTIHAGDSQAKLKGTQLDQVAGVEIDGTHFVPKDLSSGEGQDQLTLQADKLPAAGFQQGKKLNVNVTLKDGRVLKLEGTVAPERPRLTLVSKRMQAGNSAIRLGSADDVPLDGQIRFFVRSETPARFPRDEKIEVASTDGLNRAVLSFGDKSLSLQDAKTAVATLVPLKSFGDAAFGALQFRPVQADGTVGDWQPLVNLVRTPRLKEIRCPIDPDKPCTLTGDLLYLIDSLAASKDFANPVAVPTGFAETTLTVPRPSGTILYMKLRDDPSIINAVALPVMPDLQ